MIDAILALRRAVQARLIGDAALIGLIGGPRIHEEPPRASDGAHVVHGDVEVRDWSTGGSKGLSLSFDLTVWPARPGDAAGALAIAARINALLHEAALGLPGHALVSLRFVTAALRRDAKTGRTRVTLTFRALIDAD
jgi:hypothetical protein